MLRPSRLAPLVALLVALLLVGDSLLEGQQPSRFVGYDTGPDPAGGWFDELGKVGTGAVDLTTAQTLTLTGQDADGEENGITFRAGTVELL